MDKSFPFISIMGTMGCGKTTAAKLLAHSLGIHLVEENYTDNAFLPLFYSDMPRWALHSQTFFLLEKMKQLEEISILLNTQPVLQDTPLYQDVFSYAKAQFMLGNMTQEEWELYIRIYTIGHAHLPKPDCIIYLDAPVSTIHNRIIGRGRSFEKTIPESYLALLHKLNAEWISQNTTIPLYTIDTNSLNIAQSHRDQQRFIEIVSRHIIQLSPDIITSYQLA